VEEEFMNREFLRRFAVGLTVVSFVALAGCGEAPTKVTPAPSPLLPSNPAAVGCVPVSNGTIGFAGTNVYVDNVSILAGDKPADAYSPAWSYGEVHTATPSTGSFSSQAADGSISFGVVVATQATPNTQNGYYYPVLPAQPTTGSIGGQITLNAMAVQTINYFWSSNSWGSTSTAACVSKVTIWAIHNGSQLNSTLVYLYLNNTEHGVKIKVGGL